MVHLDLSSLESVRKCAKIILEQYTQINILINNAGVSIPPKMGVKTAEGYEINFGVNHLGHFLLTNLLIERMKSSAPSRSVSFKFLPGSLKEITFCRVVIVSSKLHEQGIMDWEAFEGSREFEGGKRGPNAAYCSSKLANVLFGIKLAEMLKVFLISPNIQILKFNSSFEFFRIKESKSILFVPGGIIQK